MTKIKKVLLVALLSSANLTFAINREDAAIKRDTSIGWSKVVRGSDTVLMNLQYIGAATECVVAITNHYIQASAPNGTIDTAFNVGVTSFSFDASTTNTIGSVCNAIDALANYKCSLRGARPQDDPKILRDQVAVSTTNNLKAPGGFDVKADTGGIQAIVGLPVSGQLVSTFFERVFVKPWDQTRRVLVKKCSFIYDGGEPNTVALNIYGRLAQDEGIDDGQVKKLRNSDFLNYSVPIVTFTSAWASYVSTSIPFVDFSVNGVGGLEWAEGETALLETVSLSSANQTQNSYLKCEGEIR